MLTKARTTPAPAALRAVAAPRPAQVGARRGPAAAAALRMSAPSQQAGSSGDPGFERVDLPTLSRVRAAGPAHGGVSLTPNSVHSSSRSASSRPRRPAPRGPRRRRDPPPRTPTNRPETPQDYLPKGVKLPDAAFGAGRAAAALYFPPAAPGAKAPCVVFCHAFAVPPASYKSTFKVFQDNGWAVIAPTTSLVDIVKASFKREEIETTTPRSKPPAKLQVRARARGGEHRTARVQVPPLPRARAIKACGAGRGISRGGGEDVQTAGRRYVPPPPRLRPASHPRPPSARRGLRAPAPPRRRRSSSTRCARCSTSGRCAPRSATSCSWVTAWAAPRRSSPPASSG